MDALSFSSMVQFKTMRRSQNLSIFFLEVISWSISQKQQAIPPLSASARLPELTASFFKLSMEPSQAGGFCVFADFPSIS